MSLQPRFFGKNSVDPVTLRPTPSNTSTMAVPNTGVAKSTTVAPPPPPTEPVHVEDSSLSGAPIKEGGSKLTVGPNIKLKGVEITDCDTLVVEGTVEATMDSRVMHITKIGTFMGSADIDYAEIHGEFNGDLTVREKLVIYASGRVKGKISYGKLVIQEGGQLMGDIHMGVAKQASLIPNKLAYTTPTANAETLA